MRIIDSDRIILQSNIAPNTLIVRVLREFDIAFCNYWKSAESGDTEMRIQARVLGVAIMNVGISEFL